MRDEHDYLPAYLEACEPWVDSYLICDTGSKDDTREIARAWLEGHAGRLIERRWDGFADALNAAIDAARPLGSHLFHTGVRQIPTWTGPLLELLPDVAYGTLTTAELEWYVPVLHASHLPARFVGRTHSYLSIDYTGIAHLPVTVPDSDPDSRPAKLRRDLRYLTRDHLENPTEPRWAYYIAQTYRCLGQLDMAVRYYRMCRLLGTWPEEGWHALYMEAICSNSTHGLLEAYDLRPHRAEPLRSLANAYRAAGYEAAAALFDREADLIPWPTGDVLFIEPGAYAARADGTPTLAHLERLARAAA